MVLNKEREVRRAARESGQDLVEFALIAPILFAVLFGIIEFGVAVWRYNTVANAAREGARDAIVYPVGERETRATTTAISFAQGIGLDISGDNVHYSPGEFPIVSDGVTRTLETVEVTVAFTHTSITGLFFDEIPMRASSQMLVE